MSLWIVCIIILFAALTAVILPVIRLRTNNFDQQDAIVYRDQLTEIERDIERGILSAKDGDILQDEIKKRMKKNKKNGENRNGDQPETRKQAITKTAVIISIIPFTSLGLYSHLGSPGKPDLPFAKRKFIPPSETANGDLKLLLKRLKKRLNKNPNEIDGWTLLGQSLVSLEKFNEASDALKRAFQIDPSRAEIAASIAETKFMANGGTFDTEVRHFFKKAQKLNPREHKALYYLGLDSFTRKRYQEAIQYWVDLISVSPLGAPWLDTVRERLVKAADFGKFKISDFSSRLISPSDNPANLQQSRENGPTQDDINNAKSMTKKEREQFIRSMVERLAERLKLDPDNLDGWRRLARSYTVLGEQKKAAIAEQRVKELEK